MNIVQTVMYVVMIFFSFSFQVLKFVQAQIYFFAVLLKSRKS